MTITGPCFANHNLHRAKTKIHIWLSRCAGCNHLKKQSECEPCGREPFDAYCEARKQFFYPNQVVDANFAEACETYTPKEDAKNES